MKYATAAVIVLLALGGLYLIAKPATFGGTLTSSVSSANLTITTATTSVSTSADNLQFLQLTAAGNGDVWCSFGSDLPVLKSGLHLNPIGSSTLTQVTITDPNLLRKRMVCIATANTSTSILKY